MVFLFPSYLNLWLSFSLFICKVGEWWSRYLKISSAVFGIFTSSGWLHAASHYLPCVAEGSVPTSCTAREGTDQWALHLGINAAGHLSLVLLSSDAIQVCHTLLGHPRSPGGMLKRTESRPSWEWCERAASTVGKRESPRELCLLCVPCLELTSKRWRAGWNRSNT